MSFAASVISTFGNESWNLYAKKMLESFVAYWPKEIALCVFLDDETLKPEVEKIIRPQDGLVCGWDDQHKAFVERNKHKDDPNDYRKQAVRFCHKVFALKQAAEFWKANPGPESARYLIWLDADVHTTRKIELNELQMCLPKDGDAVAYLGRKDWDHSECGWLAFDLQNLGHNIIDEMFEYYKNDMMFISDKRDGSLPQAHDSAVFDFIRCNLYKATNLTEGKPGREIWPHSPMAAWSRHYKGPAAKQELIAAPTDSQHSRPIANPMIPRNSNIKIETKNSIPNEKIQEQIERNQRNIKNWVSPCKKTDEEIVVVSAGPLLIAEDLYREVEAGRRIVAVKHALEPLRAAGIKPWACILLDPRPHLAKFVENPDKDIIWFVASQVHPSVVEKLIDSGCTIWGYHAAVGAAEGYLTEKQTQSIVSGGSATATRGLFMLEKLGFHRFRLYGYELALADKPDMHEVDEFKQPKHFEMSVQAGGSAYQCKKAFWTKAELIAQFEEFNQILQMRKDWEIKAFGEGMVPFVVRSKEVSDLREKAKIAKLGIKEYNNYEELLGCRNKQALPIRLLVWLRSRLLRPRKVRSF